MSKVDLTKAVMPSSGAVVRPSLPSHRYARKSAAMHGNAVLEELDEEYFFPVYVDADAK